MTNFPVSLSSVKDCGVFYLIVWVLHPTISLFGYSWKQNSIKRSDITFISCERYLILLFLRHWLSD